MDNKWIPTSERLPEVDKYGEAYVLVCMDDEFIATTTYVKDEGFELWADSGEVIARMPFAHQMLDDLHEFKSENVPAYRKCLKKLEDILGC